jgi:excisionase family DNA binding protein
MLREVLMKKEVYTVAEAAELLNCHDNTIRREIKRGKLRAAKVGNDWRISKADLEVYWTDIGGRQLFSTEGISPIRIEAVRQYLREHFQRCELADRYDFDRIAQTFRLECDKDWYLITVSRAFLDDNPETKIPGKLDSFSLVQFMTENPASRIVVTNRGLRVEAIRVA